MQTRRLSSLLSAALIALVFAPVAASQNSTQTLARVRAPDAAWQDGSVDTSRIRGTHPARLVNVSARAFVDRATEPLIAGAAIRGSGVLPTLVRAIGPGLTQFGVGNPLRNPSLTVYASDTLVAETNTLANTSRQVAAYVGAFPALAAADGSPMGDAAIVGQPSAGRLTAHCISESGGSGVALVEFYDSDGAPGASSAHFVNLSARARVQSGDGVIVVGFVVAGEGTLRLLLRGVGQTLSGYGVSGTLTNPAIELYSGTTLIASNDDWKTGNNATPSELSSAAEAAGAFPLTSDSDAALIVTLPAGSYTLHVRGASGQSGQALGEMYELDEAVAFDFARSTNQVGLELFRELLASERSPNLIISPYSIETAMALAYVGAAGDTRLEMARVLKFPADNSVLQSGYASMRDAMKKLADDSAALAEKRNGAGAQFQPVQWNIANRLFGQQGYPFRQSFMSALRDGFEAPFQAMDFAREPEPSRLAINAWVAEQTRDKILDLIPSPAINPLTRFVLVNALYLKANWDVPFQKALTSQQPFNVSPTVSANVPTMRRTEYLGYASERGRTVVTLDYIGNGLQFVIVLPAVGESVDAAALSLTVEDLTRWSRLGSNRTTNVALWMPRFKMEGASVPLSPSLQTLGMRTPFVEALANFDAIAPRETHPLFLTQVYHRTFVAVDEEGTEAAAATAVLGGTTSIPTEPVEVRVDRPFLFLIQHKASGACLFIGKITDPR